MAIRTTIDIPEPLHEILRQSAQRTGTSIRALIVRAIEETYQRKKKGVYVRGPMLKGPGKLGPAFPTDENPSDFILP
jgi:hypothetical protein